MKITVGVPCQDTIKSKTASSLFGLLEDKENEIRIVPSENCLVHENRNILVEIAKQMESDYLFFVDSDLVFEKDILTTLLEANKDIVAASYNRRSLPEESMIRNEKGGLIELQGLSFLFKAGYVPTGCMLIKMSVFNKLNKPYFFFKYKDGEMDLAEDYYFCEKAREAGIEVWCDPTITVRHLGDYFY